MEKVTQREAASKRWRLFSCPTTREPAMKRYVHKPAHPDVVAGLNDAAILSALAERVDALTTDPRHPHRTNRPHPSARCVGCCGEKPQPLNFPVLVKRQTRCGFQAFPRSKPTAALRKGLPVPGIHFPESYPNIQPGEAPPASRPRRKHNPGRTHFIP